MSDNTNTQETMSYVLSRGEMQDIVYSLFNFELKESIPFVHDLVGRILTENGIATFGKFRRATMRTQLDPRNYSALADTISSFIHNIVDSMHFRDLFRGLRTLKHGAREEQGVYIFFDHFPETCLLTQHIPLFSDFLEDFHYGREGTPPFYSSTEVESFSAAFTVEENGSIRVTYYAGVPDRSDEDSEDLIFGTVSHILDYSKFWSHIVDLAAYRFSRTFNPEGTTVICEDLSRNSFISFYKGEEPDEWILEFFDGIKSRFSSFSDSEVKGDYYDSYDSCSEGEDYDVVPVSSAGSDVVPLPSAVSESAEQ
jgi:hypothetical protein